MAVILTKGGLKSIPDNPFKKKQQSNAIPKGGLYIPSKTGSGGTYFVGGQGYSVQSDPNVPKAISDLTSKKTSGGGSSTPRTSGGGTTPQVEVIITPQGGQSVQTPNLRELANRKAAERLAQIRKEKERRIDFVNKLRGQSSLTPIQRAVLNQEMRERSQVYATYDPYYRGVVTSKGEFYPTKNKNWRPFGTKEGYGYSFPEGVGVGPGPTTPKKVIETLKKNKSYIEKLTSRIEKNKIIISPSERKEYYYLGRKQNKTEEENRRFNQLANKVSNQIKQNSQRIRDTVILTTLNLGIGVKDLASSLWRNPRETIKALPSAFIQGIRSDLALLKTDPLVGVTKIGTELLIFRSIGKASKATKERAANYLTKTFDPRYVGDLRPGRIITINLGNGNVGKVEVVSRIPKETLAKQVSKAGKKIPLAISSQSDSLLKFFQRAKEIRKPIPGEEKFSPLTRRLLNKFDSGTISKNELIKLNSLIRKQGAKGLLERSFFVDPTGKIRPSRLGILREEEGGFLDYFRRGVTFRRPKPQILLFDNIIVENFPPSLRRVAIKLKRGMSLNPRETNALINFQLKKSGKFKPIGFVTGESELTLAPGEIIKRTRVVGKAIIKGKRVPIIKAEVIKPTGRIKVLLDKLDKGRVSKREGYELADLLRRKTGLKYTYSSLKRDTRKYFSLKKAGLSSVIYASKKGISRPTYYYPKKGYFGSNGRYIPGRSTQGRYSPTTKRYIYGKPTPYIPRYQYPGSPKFPPKYPPKGPPTRSPPFPPKYPPKGPPTFKLSSGRRSGRKLRKGSNYFDVYAKPIKNRFGKKASRFIKVNTTPLNKNEAKDLRNYIADTSLSRTAFYTPSKSKPGKNTLSFPRGYASKTNFKFRGFRIVKGKRFRLKNNRVIEYSKNALDTVPEKKKIDLLRRIREIRKSPTTRKTINTSRRLVKGSKQAKLYMAKLRRMKRR